MGGILRNKNGEWILGYHKHIGKCSVLDVELWAINDELKRIQQRGHAKVIIQSNSLEAIKNIHGSASKASQSALIRRIHRIMSQEMSWHLHYIPNEKNQSADFIAKLAFKGEEDLQLLEAPSEAVLDLIRGNNERIFCISVPSM